MSGEFVDDLRIENLVLDGNRSRNRGSKVNGVLFRPERGPDFAGHRNRLEENTFIDNAPEGGAVIDIQGGTEEIILRANRFTETRGGGSRRAVQKGPETRQIVIEENSIDGLKKE